MTIWTIAAQAGTGGDRIAAELAASVGVPLFDRQTLARFAHDLNPDELEVKDIGSGSVAASACWRSAPR
jgi:hypothetical protein